MLMYYELMDPFDHDMVKWQYRGVRDPEIRSGEPHRHIEHAGPLGSSGLNDASDDTVDLMPTDGQEAVLWTAEEARPRDIEASGEVRYIWEITESTGPKAWGPSGETHLPNLWMLAFWEMPDWSWSLLQMKAAETRLSSAPNRISLLHGESI
ncbi:hypothetical protein F511_11511 [Dorcoceras hygrometricum]|uniref:Uncharacterized protein n=1 Tax=Dorcoceras hygrometricum TaxID=472368 RepID=A0A2Z7A4J1_9LAMI|nr:hypothetical protein F511_11511 [Dorcoceras hygrometricum]